MIETNKMAHNEFSAESLELLRELNVNIGAGYRACWDEVSNIDDEWLNEFVEEYNF